MSQGLQVSKGSFCIVVERMLPLFVGLCQGELKAKVHICLEEVKVYLGLDLGFVLVGFHSKMVG